MENTTNINLTTPQPLVVNNATAEPLFLIAQNVLNILDITIRVACLLVHIIYIIIVVLHKELKTISLVQMHHTNFIGLVSAINFALWINTTKPPIDDINLYNIVCALAEAAWVIIKYARSYSILILAIYRFIAVFHMTMYKKISQSYLYTFASCAASWLCGIIVFIVAKYASHTQPGPTLCTDGWSPILLNSGIFQIIVTLLGYVGPIITVVVLYVLIRKRLDESSKRAGKSSSIKTSNTGTRKISEQHSSQTNSGGGSSSAGMRKKSNKLEQKLAFQFVALNVLELISALSLTGINISLFIPNFNFYYYQWRQLLRCCNNIALLLIPVISLVCHPFKMRKMPCS